MTEKLILDVVLFGGAIISMVALTLLWNGWRIYTYAEAKTQRELSHALERAARRK